MAVKGVLYEVGKLNIVEEGTTVMFLNFILKREGGKSVSSQIEAKYWTGSIEEFIVKQGREIACLPPAA